MRQDRFKTALVLSGGGSRALAHLGVMDEILKNHGPVDLIVGTSMGAIIGGLYAYHGDLAVVAEKMRGFLKSELFVETLSRATSGAENEKTENYLDRFVGLFRKGIYYTYSIVRSTLVSEQAYLEVMSDLIPVHPIEELRLPFAAVTMDILSGEEVVMRTGCLRKAVSASVAIPGILPPVQCAGRYLVDGGWVDNVPATPAIALGAHFIISVDASAQIYELGPLPSSALDLLHRSNDIARILLSHERRLCTDVLLIPPIGEMSWDDFTDIDHPVSAGHRVVLENLSLLKRTEYLRKVLSLRGWLHPARGSGWQRPMIFV